MADENQEIQQNQVKKLKLPDKIHIGHLEYEVIERDDLIKDDEFVSRSSNNMHRYYLQKGIHPAQKRYQLFFLIHKTHSYMGVPRLSSEQNAIVGNFIYEFLRDNEPLRDPLRLSELGESGLWILGERWSLQFMVPEWRNTGHMNSLAMCFQINSGVPVRERWETMWHELYHRAFLHTEIRDDQEEECTRMAHLMCNFLTFNDVSWLFEDLEAVKYSAPGYEGCSPRSKDVNRVNYEGPC